MVPLWATSQQYLLMDHFLQLEQESVEAIFLPSPALAMKCEPFSPASLFKFHTSRLTSILPNADLLEARSLQQGALRLQLSPVGTA